MFLDEYSGMQKRFCDQEEYSTLLHRRAFASLYFGHIFDMIYVAKNYEN